MIVQEIDGGRGPVEAPVMTDGPRGSLPHRAAEHSPLRANLAPDDRHWCSVVACSLLGWLRGLDIDYLQHFDRAGARNCAD